MSALRRPPLPVVLALDLATITGWAIRHADGRVVSGFRKFPSDSAERLWAAELFLRDLVRGADWVFVERAGFVNRFHVRSLRVAMQLRGELDKALRRATVDAARLIEVAPASWKKTAVGNGRATKADVMAAIVQEWPHVSQQDEADALGLLKHGLEWLEREPA